MNQGQNLLHVFVHVKNFVPRNTELAVLTKVQYSSWPQLK